MGVRRETGEASIKFQPPANFGVWQNVIYDLSGCLGSQYFLVVSSSLTTLFLDPTD